MRFIASFLAFVIAPLSAHAIDKALLGEECYDILHSKEEVEQSERERCLEKFRSLSTIVITPSLRPEQVSSVPASFDFLNQTDLERSGAESLAEALRDLPGIEISDSGQAGLKRIRIRGEESRRVKILIDGQEFADQREVGTPLLIAPEMIERVEVLRGTGSVLHGSRAIGGVVNFITKKGGYHPVQATLSSKYYTASNGHQEFASLYGKYKEIGYRVSGTLAEHNDRNSADGDVENTSFDNNSFSLFLGKAFENHEISLIYEDYDSSSEVYVEPEVRFSPPFTDFQIDSPRRDRSKLGLFYDGNDLNDVISRLHLDAYYQRGVREFNTFSDLELAIGAGTLIRDSDVFTDSTQETLALNGQIVLNSSKSTETIIGVNLKSEDLDQLRVRNLIENGEQKVEPTIEDEARQDSLELFAENVWSFGDDFDIRAGLRGIWYESELRNTTREGLAPTSNTDTHIVAALGARYRGVEDATFWASWSQGFVYPTMINLGTGAYAGPNFVNPNPELEPETSNSFEIGARHQTHALMLESSLFYIDSRDYIDHVRCSAIEYECLMPAGRADRVYVNVDKARSFGAEFAARYQFEKITPYVNASWIRRRFERDNLATYETGIPALNTRFGVEYERTFDEILTWLDLYVRASSDADELDAEVVEQSAGWGTLNARLGVEFGGKRQYRLILDLLNLGDKSYSSSTENIPANGRSAVIQLVLDL
jgi:hemoglobin/transferrin/lactoferrin receptor protein